MVVLGWRMTNRVVVRVAVDGLEDVDVLAAWLARADVGGEVEWKEGHPGHPGGVGCELGGNVYVCAYVYVHVHVARRERSRASWTLHLGGNELKLEDVFGK